jgi:hypothetical protein
LSSTDKATHDAAKAAQDSAKAALVANETTRAQLAADLIIPHEPRSTIKIDRDGKILVDLYIANTGQSWAKGLKIDARLAIKPNYDVLLVGGPANVSPQEPLHFSIDEYPPFHVQTNGLTNISATITLTFATIFKEIAVRTVTLDLVAGLENMAIPCCSQDQLAQGVPLLVDDNSFRLPNPQH